MFLTAIRTVRRQLRFEMLKRRLAALDDHQLHDLGLERYQIPAYVRRAMAG